MIRSKRALEVFTNRPLPIHRAPTSVSITPAQALELQLCAGSFEYFAKRYLKVAHPTLGRIAFETRPYQQKIVNTWTKADHTIVVQPRQSGATLLPMAMMLWDALFKPCHLNVIAFAKHSQSQMRVVQDWVAELPDWLKPGVKYSNRDTIQFDNASAIRVAVINANACRGMSISNLFVDNYAWANAQDQEDFWYSISPVISCGGKVIMTGTPHGNKNMFAHIWNSAVAGSNSFTWLKIAGHEAHTLKHLQDMATILGADQYMREYEGSFA